MDSSLIPEETIHTATLKSIRDREISWVPQGETEKVHKVLLNWCWEIVDGEYAGRRVYLTTNSDLNLGARWNQFRNVVETLTARTIKPEDPPLNTDDLIGLTTEISIKHRADKKDPSKKYHEVDEVLPPDDAAFTVSDEPPF